MGYEEFDKSLRNYLSELNIELDEKQIIKFYRYMELLLEWNEKINLTAIIDPKEIILKHFADSLTISKHIKKNAKVIDVGTGAGFPGIPLKIYREDIEVTLLDSLNKRISFLNEVIEKLELAKIDAVHGRAEEVAHNRLYRENFDVATSRAVANMATLSEYLIPFSKVSGNIVAMKGPDTEKEIEMAKKAINILGAEITKIEEFNLPNSEIKRTIILIKKNKQTLPKFPRKPGTPSKEPLI